MKSANVLFVCLGNICRSPTAEGVFREFLLRENRQKSVFVDSAGTSDWHIDQKPDARTIKAAALRGYDLSALRGRQVTEADFDRFDYILAMDSNNLRDLKSLEPDDFNGHLGLFLDFAKTHDLAEVPDPYHGGDSGFQYVLDLVEDACQGLLAHLANQ